jgi:hypothetical protein
VLATVLEELKAGAGPQFVRGETLADAHDPDALLLMVAGPVDIPGHDAWLLYEIDFTNVLAQMVTPRQDQEITIVLRDEKGRTLAAAGEEIKLYAEGSLESVDPRLGRFFATDDPAIAAQHWKYWRETNRIPPLDPSYQLTLPNCGPNNDIAHAFKVHYNPVTPERYIGVTLAAPYERFLSKTVAGHDFLVLLMVLAVSAVLALVFLALRLLAHSSK